jgi:tRNA pseudouridine32 synthase/23S rRNA pseudouridine746 synthase
VTAEAKRDPAEPPPPTFGIRVIYEDADLLAVDKPFGLSFHSDDLEGVANGTRSEPAPGLLATIRQRQAEGTLFGSSYRGDLYSVHRLDKVTSGICVFAKNPRTAEALGERFRRRRVHKYYVALSARKPSKKMGTVSGDMTRSRRGAWRLVRAETRKAKDDSGSVSASATTSTASRKTPATEKNAENAENAEDLKRNPPKNTNEAVTKFASRGLVLPNRALRFFVLRPLTGRTHQLRVACKSLGAPILGDAAYAETASAKKEDRTYLHAAAMRFALPAPSSPEEEEEEEEDDDDDRHARVSSERLRNASERIVEIVCKPSQGEAWSDSVEFEAAWLETGLEKIQSGNLDVWFEDQPLLRSRANDLLRDAYSGPDDGPAREIF